MAAVREYGYYITGNTIKLVERDVNFDNDANSKSYGPGVDRGEWKSPLATVADGLQLQYTYVPVYRIDETDKLNKEIDAYISGSLLSGPDGLLKLTDSGNNNYSTSPESLSDGDYIVLEYAGKWNGLHKVRDAGAGYVTTYTPYSGSSTVGIAFEEAVFLYYNVSVMQDESFDLDLPDNLNLALEYYLRARMFEQALDLEKKEYYMKEFRKIIEKHDSSRQWGARMVASGPHAIR